jgi:hypothetical protein
MLIVQTYYRTDRDGAYSGDTSRYEHLDRALRQVSNRQFNLWGDIHLFENETGMGWKWERKWPEEAWERRETYFPLSECAALHYDRMEEAHEDFRNYDNDDYTDEEIEDTCFHNYVVQAAAADRNSWHWEWDTSGTQMNWRGYGTNEA